MEAVNAANPPPPFHALDHHLLDALREGPVGWGLFDPQERLQAANAAFLDAFATTLDGAPCWETLMRRCHAERRGLRVDTDDIDAWIARVRQSYRRVPLRCFESDLVDGRWMWVTETLNPEGWVLALMTDVTPLKTHESTLRSARDQAVLASHTDPLTELYNRRYIFDRLDDLIASTRGMRLPLAVAMIDLDDFKHINDQHGHGVGDRVLKHFAAQLKRHLRPLDTAGRIGGEEFLLVLPNAPQGGAQRALELLRALLHGAVAPLPDLPALRYSFSAGLALVASTETGEQLVRRADRALYRAKREGRDRLVAADDGEPVG
jgi:diguanylate cyclase (GGDEF)-like protein